MKFDDAVRLLKEALTDSTRFQECIATFQQLVFRSDEFSGAAGEILRDLAHDLDYFEPNAKARAEDPAFFDAERAKLEIEQALHKLEQLS